jgi:hypothetical protein
MNMLPVIAMISLIFCLKPHWLKSLLFSLKNLFLFLACVATMIVFSALLSHHPSEPKKNLSTKEKAELYDEMMEKQEMNEEAYRESIDEMGPY